MGGPTAFREVMRDLTDAQREQVKAIHERHAERMRPLPERSHTAREALNAAVLAGNAGNFQALSIEVGSAETELSFAQAQVQAEIFNVLTAEQKQTIAERRKQMEARRGEMIKRRQKRTVVGSGFAGSGFRGSRSELGTSGTSEPSNPSEPGSVAALLLLLPSMSDFVLFIRRFSAGSLLSPCPSFAKRRTPRLRASGSRAVPPSTRNRSSLARTSRRGSSFATSGSDRASTVGSAATTPSRLVNIEFLYHIGFGQSGWSVYQGGGPAVVLLRQDDNTSVHAGSFITFGFAHEGGFFTDFKLGTGNAPMLKFTAGYTIRKRTP